MDFRNAKFRASYGTFRQIPPSDGIEIAFSGRSNVGKSSLINRIFGRKNLARVSSQPGKTATINIYELENIRFADLPGYGYAKVSKSEKERWSGLIGGYLSDGRRDLELIFQLVDMRHPPSADDIAMINYLIDSELPFVVVLTKADKLNRTERAARLEALRTELPCYDQLTVVPFSAVTDEGVEEIRGIVREIAGEEH